MKKTIPFLIFFFGASFADTEKPSVADVVSEVSPSVVMVRAEKIQEEYQPGMLIIRKDCRIGTGFIIDERGYILTCSHIIKNYDTLYVELKSGKGYIAKIVKIDPKTDAGLLKISSKDRLPSVKIGDPRRARPGDTVITIGNPLPQELGLGPKSFKPSVACGVIGSTERLSYDNKKLFQLSLPVNFGNSGGPLLNDRGEVIGLINSKMTGFSGRRLEGIGFAISIEELKEMFSLLPRRMESISQCSVLLQKNREPILLLIIELLLILILTFRISQRRKRDYRLIKQRIYKTIYRRDYYGYSKILQRIFKDYRKGSVNYLHLLTSDIISFKSKEDWLLPELKRQIEDSLEHLHSLDRQREAMIYRAKVKRSLR
jgi:hypothetical protein